MIPEILAARSKRFRNCFSCSPYIRLTFVSPAVEQRSLIAYVALRAQVRVGLEDTVDARLGISRCSTSGLLERAFDPLGGKAYKLVRYNETCGR